MKNNTPDKFFVEIFYPELVNDVKKIFKDHIFPYAEPKDKPGKSLRYLIVTNLGDENLSKNLLKKYDFLSEHLLVFRLPPQLVTPIHTDGIVNDSAGTEQLRAWRRHFSLNIPIKNCDELTKTEFFKVQENSMFEDQPTNTTWLKAGELAEKIGEYCLKDNPVLMNPQIPHKITNYSRDIYRISVSWTIKPDWSWEQLIKHFYNRLM